MPGVMIVLNGPSSAGKSMLIKELQELWTRPLYATCIDAVISGWPEKFYLGPGETDPLRDEFSVRIVPGRGPAPSWLPSLSDAFMDVCQHSHESWVSRCRAGVDVIVDHVIIDERLREMAQRLLVDAFWVGVTCDVEELVRREAARGIGS